MKYKIIALLSSAMLLNSSAFANEQMEAVPIDTGVQNAQAATLDDNGSSENTQPKKKSKVKKAKKSKKAKKQ